PPVSIHREGVVEGSDRDRRVAECQHPYVPAGTNPLDGFPDFGLHARRFVDNDQDAAMESLEPHALVGRQPQAVVPRADPKFRLARLRKRDPARLHRPVNLPPQQLLHLRPRGRRRDDDPVPVTGDEPEDGDGGDKGLPGGVARLYGDPWPARYRPENRLLKRPEVLAQEAVAEADRIADDAGPALPRRQLVPVRSASANTAWTSVIESSASPSLPASSTPCVGLPKPRSASHVAASSRSRRRTPSTSPRKTRTTKATRSSPSHVCSRMASR